jgi:hypothetical protein
MIMESIFDYELTQGELNRFGLRTPEQVQLTREFEKKYPDDRYYRLGLLFAMRGDKKKANEYWSKIEDRKMLSTLIEDC